MQYGSPDLTESEHIQLDIPVFEGEGIAGLMEGELIVRLDPVLAPLMKPIFVPDMELGPLVLFFDDGDLGTLLESQVLGELQHPSGFFLS